MALYDFQSAGIATTDDFNNMMKFFHHYYKALANGKTEDQAKTDAKKELGLNNYFNVDDYKKLKSGRFPRRDEMNAIISEFKTYAKGEVDKATDDEKEAQDKFDEAQKVQDEGQDASDQIADIKRERRGIRLKKGITATLLTAAGLCIAGPLVLGGALASSAIIGFSALAGVGFAKFGGDKEIHECGLDDRKLIRDLKQKVREAQRQNANYLARQRALARQKVNTRNTNSRFNNYEQVGSVYENILEDERSDGRNQLIQLQNDIMDEKGKAHFVTSGKGFKDSQATEQQVDNASQVVSNKLTELDNLPMDSSFQSKMEAILKDAEKEKTKVVAMDLEHKDFAAEVDNAIKAVVAEANAYENYYNSFDESIKADTDVLSKYTACTNVYSVMFGMGSLDNESVPDINNTLANLKSKSSELKKSIRTKWLEGQNSSALPEGTLEEKAYKRVIQEAENANAHANGNTNPSQQSNADAIAELNFLRARLSNLEQQRAATGKEYVGVYDSIKGMVRVNVKQEIAEALNKVNTGLADALNGAKLPTDALNEATNGIDINQIASGVGILTASYRYYRGLDSIKDPKTVDFAKAEADFNAMQTEIGQKEKEIDNLKQQQNTADPLKSRKDTLKKNLKDTYIKNIQSDLNSITTVYKNVEKNEGLAKIEYDNFMNITDDEIDKWDEQKLQNYENNIPTWYKNARNHLGEAIVEQRDIASYQRQIGEIRKEHSNYMHDSANAMARSKLAASGDTSLAYYTNLSGEIAKYLNGPADTITADKLNEYCKNLRTAAQNYKDAVEKVAKQNTAGNQGQSQGNQGQSQGNQGNQGQAPDQNTGGATQNAGGGNNQTQAQDIADDNYKKDALDKLRDIETSNNNRFNEYVTQNGLSDEYKAIGVNALKGVFEKVRENIGNATTKTEIDGFVNDSKNVVNAVKQAVEQLMQNASSATAAENTTPENPPTPPTPVDEQKPAEENLEQIPTEEPNPNSKKPEELKGLPKGQELKGLPDGRRQQILDNIGSELFGKKGSKVQVERVSQEALKLEKYKQEKLQKLGQIKTSCMNELSDPKNKLSEEEQNESRELLNNRFNEIKTDIENANTEKEVDKCIESADAVLDGLKELIEQNSTKSEGQKGNAERTEHHRTLMEAAGERLTKTQGAENPLKEENDDKKGMTETSGKESFVKVEVVLIKNIKTICAKVKGGFANFRHEKVIGKDEYLVDEGEVRDLCNKYINKLGISKDKRKELGLDDESIKNMSLEQLVGKCNELEAEVQKNAEDDGREM